MTWVQTLAVVFHVLLAFGIVALVLLIRQRLVLPDADVMLWLLPGAVIGALLALWPAVRRGRSSLSTLLLRLSLFTSLLNIAAAALH